MDWTSNLWNTMSVLFSFLYIYKIGQKNLGYKQHKDQETKKPKYKGAIKNTTKPEDAFSLPYRPLHLPTCLQHGKSTSTGNHFASGIL